MNASDPCPMNASEPAPRDARVEGDRLIVAGPPEKSYPPDGNGYVLCVCRDGMKPCVRKCCAENKMLVNNICKTRDESAVPSDVPEFSVPKFVNASGAVKAYKADEFNLVYGFKCSENMYILDPLNQNSDNFQISANGFLLKEPESIRAHPGQFFLEQFSNLNYQITALGCSLSKEELEALDIPGEEERKMHMYHIAFAMTLSLLFLFLTFLVYALIRDLRNLHGKSLMCHVATLLMAYSSFILVQLISSEISDVFCIILAYITQFSFLASFFWLNVMCFDLWRTFRVLSPLTEYSKENEAKKFIVYSIYAWGFTFFISMFTFYMDNVSDISSEIPRPEFGVNSCWFNSREALLIYHYSPIGILLLSNLLMFIHTALIIAKHMRNVENAWKESDRNKNVNHERQRFMLYLKLFIVMGVNWSLDIISLIFNPNDTGFVWHVIDIGNSLQGVLIFIIFVCKTRVLRLLNKKYSSRFSLLKSPTVSSTRTTANSYSSKNGAKTKSKHYVEMNNV